MASERYILRVTLEAKSPLMIASGDSDALADNMVVRDANDLPMLPATSLAGAMRECVVRSYADRKDGKKIADDWFGRQIGDEGHRSAVTFSDGLFHWSDDRPRDGLVLPPRTEPMDDPLCKQVLPVSEAKLVVRDHVRLNEQGTVEGTGKFERTAVPSGARFTFEISTRDRMVADELAVLAKAGLWLGGATRSGYGEMACIAFGREDLTLPADWDRWCEIARSGIGEFSPIQMAPISTNTATEDEWVLSGRIEGPLLIGTSSTDLNVDRVPWREHRIEWKTGAGCVAPQKVWVVPGTSLKGPLRHRTLYHLRKAQVPNSEDIAKDLFGDAAKGDTGSAGRLRFRDCVIAQGTVFAQTHVGLDRFTGGARRGVLFTDELLWQPEIEVRISELSTPTPVQHEALAAAMNDLAEGLCGIGAEWGEGAGIFAPGVRFQMPKRARADAGKGLTDAA